MIEIEPNVYNIFPITFFKEENFLSNKQCEVILNHVNAESILCDWINIPNLDLKERLQKRIDYFAKISKIYPSHIKSSWIILTDSDHTLDMNANGSSCINGMIFINKERKPYTLDFLNPNYMIFSFPSTDRNSISTTNELKSGSLILFPSFLVHGDLNRENKNNTETLILNFNTVMQPNPKYGRLNNGKYSS